MDTYDIPYEKNKKNFFRGAFLGHLVQGKDLSEKQIRVCVNMKIKLFSEYPDEFIDRCRRMQKIIDLGTPKQVTKKERDQIINKSQKQKNYKAVKKWAGLMFWNIRKGKNLTNNQLNYFLEKGYTVFSELLKDSEDKKLYKREIDEVDKRISALVHEWKREDKPWEKSRFDIKKLNT